jgi:NADH:ubiquinone oxidoreductase subunit 2 (subunit N)
MKKMIVFNLPDKICPFYSCAALMPAILLSVFFGLSKRKGSKIFILTVSFASIIAAIFFNIYAYISKGTFSDYLFSFNLLEAAQTSFMFFAAFNIIIFIAVGNFYRDNFIQILILFHLTLLISVFFIASSNFIAIFVSLVLFCTGVFQLITVVNSNAGTGQIKNASEYIVKNDILRFFLVSAFSILLLFVGFSLIFGASDFKSFLQILESDKIDSTLLKTGLFVLFAAVFTYLFLFPLQGAYIRLIKKCEGTTLYIIWFMYFPAGIFLFLKLRNVFFYMADNGSFYLTISVLAAAAVTLIGANLGALKTTGTRRILSFIFMANLGMLLLALGLYSAKVLDSQTLTWLFIANLFLAALSYLPVFAVFNFVEKKEGSDSVQHIAGLARNNKIIGSALIIILASFAGMFATAGYIVRVYMIKPIFNFTANGQNLQAGAVSGEGNIIAYAGVALAFISWAFLAVNIARIIIILVKKPNNDKTYAFPKFYYIYSIIYMLAALWIGVAGLLEMYGSGIYITGYSLFNISF